MEYTKDIIFKVHYDDVHNVLKLKNKKGTSYFLKKIKQHKLLTISIFISIIFVIVDIVLIMNFIRILENW